MLFEPLYYADRLHIVNPRGDVGVATLWSQVDQVKKVFERLGIDLSPETSRVAVMANLYGNGLPHMLRNLLWNPQIRTVVLLGQDLSGSRQDLLYFFERGLEQVEYLGAPAFRIAGAKRIIDGEVTPNSFRNGLRCEAFGLLSDKTSMEALSRFLAELPPQQPCDLPRVDVPIPRTEVQRYPSEPRSHTILRSTPLDAWEEIIFRLVRFGYRSRLRKGERIELQNVKVIVEEPREEPEEHLARYGFSLAHFHRYQQSLLNPVKPEDLPYTYGNRLRGYYRSPEGVVDSLEVVVRRLRDDPESRHAYISLWDNARDLPAGHACPCFVSAFFRRFEGKLTLTASFRTHNAMDAWLENVYGLMAVQRFVAERVEMEPGPITVISHSLSLDPNSLERAQKVAAAKKSDEVVDRDTGKRELRFDPNGNFTVTVDKATQELVVQHAYDGMAIHEYRGKTAEEIEAQLARDVALSEIGHALYLGREMARKELQLKAERNR